MINTNCEKEQVVVQDLEPQLTPVKRAAANLNVSTHCLYKKIREGKIPAYRFGRKVLVDMEELKKAMRITRDSQDETTEKEPNPC